MPCRTAGADANSPSATKDVDLVGRKCVLRRAVRRGPSHRDPVAHIGRVRGNRNCSLHWRGGGQRSRAACPFSGGGPARRRLADRGPWPAPVLWLGGVSWLPDHLSLRRTCLGESAPAQPVRDADQPGLGRGVMAVCVAAISTHWMGVECRSRSAGRSRGGVSVPHGLAAIAVDRQHRRRHGMAGAPQVARRLAERAFRSSCAVGPARRDPLVCRISLAVAVPGQRR
ncbi:hypothetical protein D3C71_1287250 [compost metagenome]